MSNKPKPIETFRIGNFDFAMWENQGDDMRIFQSINIKRTYMDGNGNWQDGGEIRLLPQQLADLRLGSDKMFEFWRIGMKQRRHHAAAPVRNPSSEPPARQQQEAGQNPGPDPQTTEQPYPETPEFPATDQQGDLEEVGIGVRKGFAESVSRGRSSKRSR